MHLLRMEAYGLTMTTRFRGLTVREGMVLLGEAGWGEFCPFPEYGDAEAKPWLEAAIEAATTDWPAPVRTQVPVNSIIPAVDPQTAHDLARTAGCVTAKIKVANHPDSAAEDVARVEAVRDALGSRGRLRVDANAAWDVDTAVTRLRLLDAAAGGLEYAEQPCGTLAELAAVRRRVNVPIAADESIRRAPDPMAVALSGAADIAVLKCAPLGGVWRSLEVAQACGLPCVVSSALESSVGLAAELALAAALPHLDYACGLATISLLDADLTDPAGELLPVGGMLQVPALRPVPSEERLTASRLDPVRERWWRERLARVQALL